MSSILGKSALSPEWAERFRKIAKLNAYAQSTPIRLSNVVIQSYDLSGAKLSGAEFEKTEWKNTTLKNGEFINTKFIRSTFEEVVFENVLFKDTVFEDTTFDASTFFQAELRNVRFVRCQFKNAGLESLKASTITIEDSKLEDVNFFRSAVIATVRGSKFIDVSMTGLVAPSSLTIEKSELKEVDFSDSKLNELNLVDTLTHKSGMTGGEVSKAIMSNSRLHFGMSETTIRELLIDKSEITLVAFDDAHIGKVHLTDCGKTERLNFFEATIEQFHVSRCELNNLDLSGVGAGEVVFLETTLRNSDFKGSKIKSLLLDHVLLDGKDDFTNAQVDTVTIKNLKKSPTLNLITTGSNVKLD